MDHAVRISPTLFLGAEASPRAPTVSSAEAWSSLAAIAGVLVIGLAACAGAIWLAATGF